jgi:hypothetical protein
MSTIGTLTSLQIQEIQSGTESIPYVVITQVVEYASGKKESVIILEVSHFEEMVKTYQATKSSAIAAINVLKDLRKN